jgi:hypothetical protein
MGELVNLFSGKPAEEKMSKLEFWKSRNEILMNEFHKMNAYEKQNLFDTVITINNSLYEMVLQLKGEI